MKPTHPNIYENGDAEFILLGRMFPFLLFVTSVLWTIRLSGYSVPDKDFWEPMNKIIILLSWMSFPSVVVSGVALLKYRNK